jgi:LPXTG-site transpeptidase (sortase) family protein
MATNTFLPNTNNDDDSSEPVNGSLRNDGTYIPPTGANNNDAANLIREKLNRIYAEEPDPEREEREAEAARHRSKHQQFMYELSNSGKDLATVQTEWHNYYIQLSDDEKHQVWQEFYASNTSAVQAAPPQTTVPEPLVASTPAVVPQITNPAPFVLPQTAIPLPPQPQVIYQQPQPKPAIDQAQVLAEHKHQPATSKRRRASKPKLTTSRSTKDIQSAIRDKVTANGKLSAKHHLQSLLFGLGIGLLVIFFYLFTFFNEQVIAPFIQPSRVDAATPVIVDTADFTTNSTPQVIIPKINVEIPVDYTETSTNEAAIEDDLEDGVVHYPTTVEPGQDGNAAFFGHSSNNIFNSGKYKFAFVLLHLLVKGDTFYLTYQGKIYIYKVISKTVVSPSDVSVLNSVAGQTATATLITCDPPGTSINRLVVVGQQISPDVSSDAVAPAVSTSTTAAATLPGNGPSLWHNVTASFIGKAVLGIVTIVLVWFALRWSTKMWHYYHPSF